VAVTGRGAEPHRAAGDGPAIKADLLGRLGRTREATAAYRQALALAVNDAERAFLEDQVAGPRSAGIA
jgi:predicted RNA polymerase sigma factor